MKWATPGQLRRAGIVGMNRRNIDLIARHNPRRLFPVVDNKLLTKQMAAEYDLPVPALIGAIKSQHDLRGLARLLQPHDGFAIKPAKGSGGKGILVVTERQPSKFIKPSGAELRLRDISHHVSNVLSGLYSLGGSPDVALVEELIRPDPVYNNLSIEGVPDIRIIVYRGFPVMAMMRLSTRASDGKANLHQGAVGLGIGIGSGCSIQAVQFDALIQEHPDSGAPLLDVRLPDWDRLLELAARCADATELGYLGTDLVLDVNRGPLVLELNARPGLAIQVANGSGMQPRIGAINALPGRVFRDPPAARVARSRELFP